MNLFPNHSDPQQQPYSQQTQQQRPTQQQPPYSQQTPQQRPTQPQQQPQSYSQQTQQQRPTQQPQSYSQQTQQQRPTQPQQQQQPYSQQTQQQRPIQQSVRQEAVTAASSNPVSIDVRVHSIHTDGSLRAVASANIAGVLAIRNLTVRDGERGLFLSMPSYKTASGEYKDICFPITKEFRQQLNDTVIDAYHQALVQIQTQQYDQFPPASLQQQDDPFPPPQYGCQQM